MKPNSTRILALALAMAANARAADVSMTANDANGATTSFNGAGSWSPAGAPVSGKSYSNANFLLRTPATTTTAYTFAGSSLEITGTPGFNSLQSLIYKGTSTTLTTITINNLTINGGNLRSASGDACPVAFAGNGLTVGANGMGVQVQGPTTVSAPVSGTTFIRVLNGEAANNNRVFHLASGANTFTGNLELSDANNARFQLDAGANFKFSVGATGVSNKIFGTGHAFLNGIFDIDLTAAGTTIGNTWTLVTTSTLTETYNSAFSLTGFTSDAGTAGSRLWTRNNGGVYYQFSEATGALTVVNPDTDGDGLGDAWEDQHFGNNNGTATVEELALQAGGGDPDADGATNEQEETAGTDPNSPASWPDADADGLKDAWEITYFGNIAAQGAAADPDGDRNSNLAEFTSLTDPKDGSSWPDTDFDGMNDGWETSFFTNLSNNGTADTDGDSYLDIEEHDAHTNPTVATGVRVSPVWSSLQHRWSFNGTLADSVGGSDATIVDVGANEVFYNSISNPTAITMTGGDHAASDYVKLGANLLPKGTAPVTIELWAKQNTVQNWSRIFDFNNGQNEYLMMAWTQATTVTTDRLEFKDLAASATGNVNTSAFLDNKNQPYGTADEHHIVLTLEPLAGSSGRTRVTLYTALTGAVSLGAAKGTVETAVNLVNFTDAIDALGYSAFADNTASATYNEVRIWNGALNKWTREKLHTQGPDNAAIPDTDNDFLPDGWETQFFTNTTTAVSATADNDGDLVSNRDELLIGSNPNNILSTPEDIDGDGLADSWESGYFAAWPTAGQADPFRYTGTDDPDNDGLTNEQEETNGTNPTSDDNDLDGLSDSWEKSWFTNWPTAGQANPLRFTGTDDPDGDTVDNETEETAGSNPTLAASVPSDIDGDGLLDTWETQYFTNTTAQNGSGDPDGDGYTNEQEETAKSNPTLIASIPGDINGDGITDGHFLITSDPAGTASFNSGAGWDNGQAPLAGSNYLVPGPNFLRTPSDAVAYTFAGDKVVLGSGSILVVKGTGALTIPHLGLDGGQVRNATTANAAFNLAGTINVSTASEFFPQNSSIIVDAVVSGSKNLTILASGANSVTFTAANTWTGNLTVTGGFVLGGTGSLKFKPGATTVSNSIAGAGPATFNGAFNIDLSTASNTVGSSWTLVNAATVVETYAAGFTVTGFTADAAAAGARKWTSASGTYQFDEANGVLTRITPAGNDSDSDGMDDTWENTYFSGLSQPATGDYDADGTNNLTEYRLGLTPNNGSSRFSASRAAGGLLQWPSATGLTFTVQRSTTLGSWSSIATVPGTAGTASYTDPTPPAGAAFYRILLEP